jgi:hypothetical protein
VIGGPRGVARAVLQERGGRIAAVIDLDGIKDDIGVLDIAAGRLLAHVDIRLVRIPAISGVQAVRQKDDHLLMFVIRVRCRSGKGPAAGHGRQSFFRSNLNSKR